MVWSKKYFTNQILFSSNFHQLFIIIVFDTYYGGGDKMLGVHSFLASYLRDFVNKPNEKKICLMVGEEEEEKKMKFFEC